MVLPYLPHIRLCPSVMWYIWLATACRLAKTLSFPLTIQHTSRAHLIVFIFVSAYIYFMMCFEITSMPYLRTNWANFCTYRLSKVRHYFLFEIPPTINMAAGHIRGRGLKRSYIVVKVFADNTYCVYEYQTSWVNGVCGASCNGGVCYVIRHNAHSEGRSAIYWAMRVSDDFFYISW